MKHQTENDKIYNSWRRMHTRCYDTNYHSWHRYGGRGIFVCADWQDYHKFKQDMWSTWFEGASLDRIDNDGQYSPENCRWTTKAENTKPLKYDIQEMLRLYEGGMKQKDIGRLFNNLEQDRISKLLARARRERT